MMPQPLRPGRRTEKRAVEIGEIVASHANDRIIGESLGRVLLCHHRDINRKPVRPEDRIEQTRDLERPPLRGEDGGHSFSPIRSTIRRILSLVVGSIFRYFRKKAVSVASSTFIVSVGSIR